MTFSFWLAAGDTEFELEFRETDLFQTLCAGLLTSCLSSKLKHHKSDSKQLVRWRNFKYGHLEPFLWAHLSVLTPPTLLQDAHMIMTPLTCSLIVRRVMVTSSGKAVVKKKCNTEIMYYLTLLRTDSFSLMFLVIDASLAQSTSSSFSSWICNDSHHMEAASSPLLPENAEGSEKWLLSLPAPKFEMSLLPTSFQTANHVLYCRDLLSPIFLNSTGTKTGLVPFCGSEEKVSQIEDWCLPKEVLSL